jgi:hypothetical protein
VKVQTEWFIAGSTGYSGGVAGGSSRSWVLKNVLAGFNDNDIMEAHRICSEDELIGCIDAMLSYTIPAERSAAILLPSWRGRGSVEDGRAIFEGGKVTFEHFRKPKLSFALPLSAVDGLTVGQGSPEILRLSLVFKKGTKPVETIKLEASPEETIRLMRMLQIIRATLQTAPTL